jgi:glycosyltransferase involved in cell wall biosynthesis
MTNAALALHPNAFDTTGKRLLGRQAAGESFLRGFLRHADVDRFWLWNHGRQPHAMMQARLADIEPLSRPVEWIAERNIGDLARPGVAQFPAPNFARSAWARRAFGSTRFSLCGVTHTTASAGAMDALADLMIAPLEAHDALICTSNAVRKSVDLQLTAVHDYLASEFGGARRPTLQRVTIPLGLNTSDFAPNPSHRAAWRERLRIPTDGVVVLYVGRFHAYAKMNPALMAQALELAARQTGKMLYWINAGWAESEHEGAFYREGARTMCPSVAYIEVDGRPADTRFSIWSAADIFLSFSDNIQETFGLTPVEAMAAGLPCVVTDWNGYRDTVRHGEDGFRIASVAPGPGGGPDIAFQYGQNWLNYSQYLAAASQLTAIDLREAAHGLSILILNAEFRRTLGAQAQRRAREMFDWSVIVPQYQALWAELNARREAAVGEPPRLDDPFRPDPFTLFASYPTRHLTSDWGVSPVSGAEAVAARARLDSRMARLGLINIATDAEIDQILECVAAHPSGTVKDVLASFPSGRAGVVNRGLLWLARYGALELRPPPDHAPVTA